MEPLNSVDVIESEDTMDSISVKDDFYSSFNNDKIVKMMQKMGYKNGSGLGKFEQGTRELIQVAPKVGTVGLGFSSDVEWDFSQEILNIREELEWFYNDKPSQFTFELMQSFLKIGDPKEAELTSSDFCNENLLNELNQAKEIYNKFKVKDVNKARSRANPFEKIQSVFFMNRAALKLANIDSVTNSMFSNIENDTRHKSSSGPYYFADVCAGPGGFSEYLLWRKSWKFKGFGFTLKNENDFKLRNSSCISPYSFQAFYGKNGDGNVCCPENIDDFKEKMLWETQGNGVHFMTSDGGFCVDGKENLQEILSKNIYLCQCLVALEIVRVHGHFVMKLFDTFTRFSVGLIYLMCKCFKKIAILKPNSSRPANAERYLVCCDLQENVGVEFIRNYLRMVANKFWQIRDSEEKDVLELVPVKRLKKDVKFVEFICKNNNRIGKLQILALKKLETFCMNPFLKDHRQDELRLKSLKLWKIPTETSRKDFELQNEQQDEFITNFLETTDWLQSNSDMNFEEICDNSDEWSFCALYSSETKNSVHIYVGLSNGSYKWTKNNLVKMNNLKLTKGTIVYGEIVRENDKFENNENFKFSLHIIDAFYLGNVSLIELDFERRMELIRIYAESINQTFQPKLLRIRIKPVHPLNEFSLVENQEVVLPTIGFKSEQECFYVKSILLLKTKRDLPVYLTFPLKLKFCFEQVEHSNYLNMLKNTTNR